MKKIGGGSLPRGIIMITNDEYSFVIREKDGTLTEATGLNSQRKKCKIPFIRGYYNMAYQKQCLFVFIMAWISSVFIKEKDKKEDDSSESKGFLQEVFSQVNEKLKADMDSIGNKRNTGMLIPSIIFYIILPFIIGSNPQGFTICFLVMLFLSMILNNMIVPLSRRYHAAEHMAINCYLRGKDITMENVKKSSRLSPKCGTNYEVLKIMFLIASSVLLCLFIQNYWLYLLLHCTALLTSTGICYELVGINSKLFPLHWPGLLFQYFISTEKPSQIELEVAIKAIQKIV